MNHQSFRLQGLSQQRTGGSISNVAADNVCRQNVSVQSHSSENSRFPERASFELFKSSICHRVREMGDVDFIIDTLEKEEIRAYYERAWYPESLYLLAMLDYISRLNHIPLCADYDDLRRCRLAEPLYPSGIVALCAVEKSGREKERSLHSAIPEFIRFNIVESEVRNVV